MLEEANGRATHIKGEAESEKQPNFSVLSKSLIYA